MVGWRLERRKREQISVISSAALRRRPCPGARPLQWVPTSATWALLRFTVRLLNTRVRSGAWVTSLSRMVRMTTRLAPPVAASPPQGLGARYESRPSIAATMLASQAAWQVCESWLAL